MSYKKPKLIFIEAACFVCVIASIMFMTNPVKSSNELVSECIHSYFDNFENANYANMKKYCSSDFVRQYFHDSDVFGNEKAKLLEMKDVNYDENRKQYFVQVKYEATPGINSANYSIEEETIIIVAVYYFAIENGNAVITGIDTEVEANRLKMTWRK